MKKVLILMLGLVAGTTSFANTTDQTVPSTNLVMTSDHTLKLIVSPEDAKGTVVLRDLDGHILYRNQVDLQKGLNQKFNLAELDSGTYQIAVTVGKQSTVKTFEIGIIPAQTVVKIGS